MATLVRIIDGFYQGGLVQGLYELVQDYTAFNGTLGARRNGNHGPGYIKVRTKADITFAPSLAKTNGATAKITVQGAGLGYVVVEGEAPEAAPAPAQVLEVGEYGPADGELDAPVTEFGTLAQPQAEEDYSEVETIVEVMLDIEALERALEAGLLGSRDRANARKTLARRKDKLAALTA